MIIIIVFTDTKLKSTNGLNKYAYYTTNESIQIGDHFQSSRDGRWVQVVDVINTDRQTYNNKQLNRMEKKSSIISGIKEKYLSQYVPEKVPNAKMSADGSICVLIGDEYVGMKGEELITYPEEFVMDISVYSIVKPQSQVKEGDIVVNGKSFGKVIGRNRDGSLRILSFSGYTHNKKEIKDFFLGVATVRVLVNMFDSESGFNPIIYSIVSGEEVDMKTLMLMNMMPGAPKMDNNLFSNPMMMAMMMGGKDKGNNDLLTMMMLMGGKNPFSPDTKEIKEPTSSDSTSDIIKELLGEDEEFKKAFVKAMKKKGGDK